MLKFFLLLTVNCFLMGFSALAALPDCAFDSKDPFDPGAEARMPKGPYKGQCQDSAHKRSVRELTDEESKLYGGPLPGFKFAANTEFHGKFYVAKLPQEGLEDAIAQVEHFAPKIVAAHTELRFRFKDAVELLPQVADGKDSVVYVRDLVFSAEYSAPAGVPYDLIKGLSHFAINHRLVSLEDKYETMVLKDGHTVDQYRLNMTEAEKSAMLSAALKRATVAGMHTMYNTLTHSCMTEMFRVIDLSLDFKTRWRALSLWQKVLKAALYPASEADKAIILDRMPVLTKAGLRCRGLLNARSKMPELSVER